MNTLRCILIGIFCLTAAACSTARPEKPEWFWNPNMAGHMGGIGVSGIHVRGVNAQRNLAISRAVDEIARQLGVKVSNISQITRTGTRDSSHTHQQSYSIHTVNGQTITAEIREFWENPETDELYVWMVVK